MDVLSYTLSNSFFFCLCLSKLFFIFSLLVKVLPRFYVVPQKEVETETDKLDNELSVHPIYPFQYQPGILLQHASFQLSTLGNRLRNISVKLSRLGVPALSETSNRGSEADRHFAYKRSRLP